MAAGVPASAGARTMTAILGHRTASASRSGRVLAVRTAPRACMGWTA